MKGKGSRGMPGKANKGPAPGGTGVKQRMQKQDFEKRKEWVQVLDDIAALGEDSGSTKAVQAGVTPQGQEFIWCLMRGKKTAKDEEPNIYAIDGSCRQCQFPMLNSEIDAAAGTLDCPVCGNKWNLEDGELIDYLPANNPIQWASKLANEKKGPQKLGMLPTRVSGSGKVYLRLPDGTLLNKLPPKQEYLGE